MLRLGFFSALMVLPFSSLAMEPDSSDHAPPLKPRLSEKQFVKEKWKNYKKIKEEGNKAPKVFPDNFCKSPKLTYDLFKKITGDNVSRPAIKKMNSGKLYYNKLLPYKNGLYIYYSRSLFKADDLFNTDYFILEHAITHKDNLLKGTKEFRFIVARTSGDYEDRLDILGRILIFHVTYDRLERNIPVDMSEDGPSRIGIRYKAAIKKKIAEWVDDPRKSTELSQEQADFIRNEINIFEKMNVLDSRFKTPPKLKLLEEHPTSRPRSQSFSLNILAYKKPKSPRNDSSIETAATPLESPRLHTPRSEGAYTPRSLSPREDETISITPLSLSPRSGSLPCEEEAERVWSHVTSSPREIVNPQSLSSPAPQDMAVEESKTRYKTPEKKITRAFKIEIPQLPRRRKGEPK